MNDEIRAAVKARLDQKHMTRADLARAVGKTPQAITRALNGTQDGGTVPALWQAILDALDLRLTVEAGAAPSGEGKKSAAPPAGQPAADRGQGEDLEEWGEV